MDYLIFKSSRPSIHLQNGRKFVFESAQAKNEFDNLHLYPIRHITYRHYSLGKLVGLANDLFRLVASPVTLLVKRRLAHRFTHGFLL